MSSKGTHVRNVVSGLPYMLLHSMHSVCQYGYVISHGCVIPMAKIMPVCVDVLPYPPFKDLIYRFTKTCVIFALLTYKLMLTHYFTNNLSVLPYRSRTPDNDVSHS